MRETNNSFETARVKSFFQFVSCIYFTLCIKMQKRHKKYLSKEKERETERRKKYIRVSLLLYEKMRILLQFILIQSILRNRTFN